MILQTHRRDECPKLGRINPATVAFLDHNSGGVPGLEQHFVTHHQVVYERGLILQPPLVLPIWAQRLSNGYPGRFTPADREGS